MKITEQTKLFIVEFGEPKEPIDNGGWVSLGGSRQNERPSAIYVLAGSYNEAADKAQMFIDTIPCKQNIISYDGSLQAEVEEKPYRVKAVKLATDNIIF